MTPTGSDVAPEGGLGSVLKRGAAISALATVLAQIITVVQTLVLGRLLGPYEIGVFTAGSVLVSGLVVVAQGSLGHAVIQRERDLEDAANTALVVTFVTGLVLALGLAAASPLIGIVFHDPRVGLIAMACSGLALLHACTTVPDALMQRAFMFRRRIVIDPTVSLIFAVVAITFAALGYGAWSMVIGTYASTVSWVVLSWWLAKWRPLRGRFSVRMWRDMARFSFPVFLDVVAERAREVLEQVLVGRWLGGSALGQYRYGYRIASLPSLGIIQICSYILFPAFSRIAGDAERFRSAFLRALTWIWFAALPVAALIIALAPSAVPLLLGQQWQPAGRAAAAMAGIGLGVALMSAAAEAVKGAGRSPLLNWMTALSLALGIFLLILLIPFGLAGVGVALSLSYLTVGVLSLGLARPVVGVSWRELLVCLIPTTSAAGAALAVALPLERLVSSSIGYHGPVGLVLLTVQSGVLIGVYVALLMFSPRWRTAAGEVGRRTSVLIAGRVSLRQRGGEA
ncbi:oligosaccharide flippase family protein [Mycolicibacterium rufum]|uniref:Oligosaccharide flippase family protein n=1 Tax=Mycolicibacterium rufum TaxID=318424 RepID=A0A9X2YDN0_9MYCO|nr:oligosaccharide flippase family protein [Mycolicibacterium rufum]MCV7071977.1 oligosaccharide flippase family protein [Mycolicibacterium rufum]ULP36315.1 oligosaccharide flippase family protein [Mycolicibacterium rufum]